MKKLIFLFAATVLSLTSCSKDDDNNDNGTDSGNGGGGSKLPKSEVATAEPDGTITKLDYTYVGTKIQTTSTSNSNKTVYSYNSDVLSKTENKSNDITTSYTEYVFEKGDIKSETTFSVSGDKVVTKTSSIAYTYDEAAKTQTAVTTNYPGGVPTVSNVTVVNTYDGNNLIKTVITEIVNDKNDTVTTRDYVYDAKTKYMINVSGRPATIEKAKNNVVTVNSKVVVKTDNVIAAPITTQATNSYDYDASGFPTAVKNYTGGTLSSSKTVFYN